MNRSPSPRAARPAMYTPAGPDPADAESPHRFLDKDPPCTPLTGVCKNEIIATNRPRHLWIPAYPGMMEWA